MEKGSDKKIEKLEKGPLARFKNQNLLLKKFGEVGLQVYKVITGKRTTEELRSDLDMDEELFANIINYMEEAGMVRLGSEPEEESPREIEEPEETQEPEEVKEQEEPSEEIDEEISPEIEITPDEEISPEEEIAPEDEEIPQESTDEEITPEEDFGIDDEITPEIEEDEAPKKKKSKKKEISFEDEIEPEEIKPEIEEEELPEAVEEPEEEFEIEEEKEKPEEIEFSGLEENNEDESGESPVEKIIKDKYGDIGIRVYTLIDGARTAEEIMEDTGLDEAKLVEILDFLDEQGIIKLEYPKGKGETDASEVVPKEMPIDEFGPMIEEETDENQMIRNISPNITPKRLPIQIVKSVQLRAKTMLRFGDLGDKVLAAVDSKSDLIDLTLKLNLHLYKLMDILNFLKSEGGIELVPMPRTEIRRRYGDDGFTVYKKFGKEGLMLYELIGKEMTIKEMALVVTTNNAIVYDMFLFIYEVLGIEMPINKDALKKQLGI